MVKKKSIFIFLRSFVSFGFLLTLLWIMRGNIQNIANILKSSNKMFLFIAMCISMPLSAGLAFRLKLVMSGQNIRLPMKDFIYLTFVGYFFNNFFPTAIGGDIVKAYYAAKKTNNKAASYGAVAVDRLVGMISLLSIAIIGIIFIGKDFGNSKIIWAVGIMAGLFILLLSFLFRENKGTFLPDFLKKGLANKIREKFLKLYNVINLYRHKKGLLIKAYFYSMFLQGCTITSIYFFILSLGGYIPIFKLFLIIPLVWTVSMLPSLNGLGVREGAFVYFLKGDIGAEVAFALSFLWLGVIILYSIIGGVLHLVCPVKVKMEHSERGEV